MLCNLWQVGLSQYEQCCVHRRCRYGAGQRAPDRAHAACQPCQQVCACPGAPDTKVWRWSNVKRSLELGIPTYFDFVCVRFARKWKNKTLPLTCCFDCFLKCLISQWPHVTITDRLPSLTNGVKNSLARSKACSISIPLSTWSWVIPVNSIQNSVNWFFQFF